MDVVYDMYELVSSGWFDFYFEKANPGKSFLVMIPLIPDHC
jgi:hypothetical protein